MLRATESGFEFIDRIQMRGKAGNLLIDINPFGDIKIFNINRDINNPKKRFISRVESNINTVHITNKLRIAKEFHPFTFFFKSSLYIGKRITPGFKNKNSNKSYQYDTIKENNSSFYIIGKFTISNRKRDSKEQGSQRVSKEQCIPETLFRVNKFTHQLRQPPFKNESNQGGDGHCSEGYNDFVEQFLPFHNATSEGFCQHRLLSLYSPEEVANTKGGQGEMATMHDLAVEISKRTGIDTDTVKQVLRELGDSALEVMKKHENRLHIPQLGVFEIEKLPRKRKPTLIFKPSIAVRKYKLQEV